MITMSNPLSRVNGLVTEREPGVHSKLTSILFVGLVFIFCAWACFAT